MDSYFPKNFDSGFWPEAQLRRIAWARVAQIVQDLFSTICVLPRTHFFPTFSRNFENPGDIPEKNGLGSVFWAMRKVLISLYHPLSNYQPFPYGVIMCVLCVFVWVCVFL